MNKLSSESVDNLLIKAASALRSQNHEIARLQEQLDWYERNNHAEKIASQAVERGIMDPTEAGEYAKTLAEGGRDLSMVEEFISNSTVGVPLGSGLAKTASDYGGSGETDPLTEFLLTSDIT